MKSTSRNWKRPVLLVCLWVALLIEVVALGGAGAAKFLNAGVWSGWFAAWGYPYGFSYVVGALEVCGALLLIPARSSSYAGGGLIVVMLGALLTVLRNPGQLGPSAPLVHIVLLVSIVALRWKSRWRYDRPRNKTGPSPAI